MDRVKLYNARWLATSAMAAAINLVMDVESRFDDIRGALAEGDVLTAYESAAVGFEDVQIVHLLLDDYPAPSQFAERGALLGQSERQGPLAAWLELDLRTLGIADVERMIADLTGDVAAAARRIPLALPHIRTPAGFFPAVRAAADFEQLRARLGLEPYDWPMVPRR